MRNVFVKNRMNGWSIPSMGTFTLSLVLLWGVNPICAATDGVDFGIVEMKQQEKKISGKVVDANGEPLIGVSILAKKTGHGTITDIDGNFLLNVPVGETLSFSYMGFQTQEILISEKMRTRLSIVMKVNAELLDEVVVIGYGTQSKRNVTGAVSKIKMSETENLPNTNVAQSLRGRVAGVQFTDNGRPGQNGSILIRGPRSLSADNNPLIVLDGVIYNGVISDINPNDISSMEVLKDASASAIYGSRAANGVILITSKKGTTEKPTIKLNMMYGFSEPGHTVKILSPERYIQKVMDFRREAGMESDIANVATYLAPNEAENYLAGRTIDPWDIGTQDAGIQSYDVSISGRTERVNYYMSAALSKEKGIMLNDNQDRVSFRVNLETKVTDWLTVGTNSIYARRNFSGVKTDLERLMRTSPYGSIYNENGTPKEFVVDGENSAGNMLYNAYYKSNEEIQNNLFATFYANVTIPFIKGLSYKINTSPNLRWTHTYNATRQDESKTNNMKSAGKINRNYYDWMIENIINYNKYLTKDHFIDITLLYSRNALKSETTTANASMMTSDALGWNNLGLGETQTIGSGGQEVQGVSYMARLNYRFKDKYLATFTVRRDGSSVFSANNKYATFPSAALSWLVSEESFMKKLKFIDMLKLRASYGAVGNQAISPYQSLSKLSSSQYVFGDGGTTSLGYYPSNMANSELKWETTYTTNLGLDFEILKGRIGGSIEWYKMETKDLLVKRSLPRMTGFPDVWANLGQVNNHGIEVTLNTVNIQSKDFEWNSNLTFSYNRNKIVHLYHSDTDGDGKEDDDIGNNWFIGQPITVYYDYVFDGIYQEGEKLPVGYKPGYTKVKDLDGDGEITADKDREIIGQGGQPKFRWGINNNFRYKNFTLSFFINSMQGWISNFGLVGRGPVERSLNFIDVGWWTPENKSQSRPSLMHENKYNHSWYYSRNFVRIQDVSLTYDVPKFLLEKVKISTLKLSVSGKNLYTFTDWIGSDPESGGTTWNSMYPMPRTIVFGLNIGF